MRVITLFLLLFSIALPVVNGQNSDKEVLAHFETQGHCFYYTGKKKNNEKSIAPCKKWCEKKYKGTSKKGLGCKTKVTDFSKLDKAMFDKDDDGNEYIPGECFCEDPQKFKPLIKPVIDALQNAGNIICAVWLEAFNQLAQGAATVATGGSYRAIVQGAKTFVENGLGAQDFFGGWVGKVCKVPDWNFDVTDAFGKLKNAPDKVGKSIGCFQKDNKCKKVESDNKSKGKGKGGKKKGGKKNSKSKSKPKPNQQADKNKNKKKKKSGKGKQGIFDGLNPFQKVKLIEKLHEKSKNKNKDKNKPNDAAKKSSSKNKQKGKRGDETV
ncbi:hypothetical protein AJ79_02392 [Helicocarpus griseus UAMH5409]|uniref:Uncharacterized protein n=1 Tax=Helicocarpus griseus UAMH5409 TaxID=1447875 RepID=A0A2B7Y1S8_9EURO|nr:hypothetical protein AJ79_02392 [Helicocarpus griseus UAMH5409]